MGNAQDDLIGKMFSKKEKKQEGLRERRYRKKPVVIEAIQLLAYTQGLSPVGNSKGSDLWQWMTKNGASFWMEQKETGPAYMIIQTLEGNHRADILDWIIKGAKGEFYPCKPDVFEMTYEKVED